MAHIVCFWCFLVPSDSQFYDNDDFNDDIPLALSFKNWSKNLSIEELSDYVDVDEELATCADLIEEQIMEYVPEGESKEDSDGKDIH